MVRGWLDRNGLVVLCGLICQSGCGDRTSERPTEHSATRSAPAVAGQHASDAEIAVQVEQFCGACHVVPPPDDFPKHAWRKEVQQGYDFYFQSSRTNLRVPVFSDVLRYYETRAPERLAMPLPSPALSDHQLKTSTIAFRQQTFGDADQARAVSFLLATPGDQDSPARLLLTEMRFGEVLSLTFAAGRLQTQLLARLAHPAHIEPCDLDQDGQEDFIVADLGSYPPADHDRGRVVWLRPNSERGECDTIPLLEGRGRIADVRAGDLDQDGDPDLVVAEFGWRRTGNLLLLENLGLAPPDAAGLARPTFALRTLDERPGAIHVPLADFNADGRIDIATVFSQEHESVEVFLNQGDLDFRGESLFRAGTPTFGSSGIHLVDLDQDGDLDVLYTNGDMLDDYLLRDSHAIHWLENRGDSGWKHHELAKLPGVCRAVSADLDGDGDLDIVACALIPPRVLAEHPDLRLDSLIWLEQTQPGVFVRHVLETGVCQHAALDVGDFDGDGDIDIAVGYFAHEEQQKVPLVSIWWNEGTRG